MLQQGYLPSPRELPKSVACKAECVARWGDRKGKNGYKLIAAYNNEDALKRRYEQVHQRPLGFSILVYFALGWVAKEKCGEDTVDSTTFACWRAKNHDGPFEELKERVARIANKEHDCLQSGRSKARGHPSREKRGNTAVSVAAAEVLVVVVNQARVAAASFGEEAEKQCVVLPAKRACERNSGAPQRRNPARRCYLRFGRTLEARNVELFSYLQRQFRHVQEF